ncbi:MAG: hypothetical protein ACRC9V_12985 [Aeromonas sp.]
MKAHYTFRQVFAIFSPNKDFAAGVRKISKEKERLTLVAPNWSNQQWFPDQVKLLIAPPWSIPLR